jgi:hypothetical protein
MLKVFLPAGYELKLNRGEKGKTVGQK